MKANRLLWLFFILLITSCNTTRYYVVRHAEKLNNSADSPLNADGFRRAETLADTLKNKSIKRIYVSNRQRTAQTAAPTATLFSITPQVVPESETANLINQLKRISGKNVLVVRHSPEIHQIVNALSPFDQISPISNEFHLMFVVTRRTFLWQRRYNLKRLTYGEH